MVQKYEIKKNKLANENTKSNIAKNNELKTDTINIGSSIAGSIVGLALGGPIGAIIGASTGPTLKMTYNIFNRALARRKDRALKVIEKAFIAAKMTPDEAIYLLNAEDKKVDDLISLLRIVIDSDPSIDNILSSIIGESLNVKTTQGRERLLILGDAIRNLRSLHIKILELLYNSGGSLKATEIAKAVCIPVIELRSVVRDLELRGMILDLDEKPMKWKLRELGEMLIKITIQKNNKE